MSNKIFKAGIGYTLGNYLIKGLSFFTIPIFARILSTSEYGLFSTYIAYESILSSVIGFALHTSLKNAKMKYGNEYDDYCSAIIIFELFSLVFWIIICVLLTPFIKRILDLGLIILILLVIHCSCSSILSIFNVHLSITYSYKTYIIIALFNAIANVVLSLLLIFTIYDSNKYLGRVLGTVIPLIFIAIFIIKKFWKHNSTKKNIFYLKYAISYSMPLIPHAISQVVLNQFDRIMIKSMVGVSQSGIYSFGYNIYTIIEVAKTSLDNVWSPWFYENYRTGKYNLIRKRSTLYASGIFLFSVFVMMISPELIKLLGSKKYLQSAYVVIPICAAGFFSFLYTLPAQVEYYLEKTNYIAIGTLLAAIINILLNYIFISKYGYIAAAYTTEFTYIIYFVAHLRIANKLTKEKLFETKKLFILSFMIIAISIYGVVFINYFFLRLIMAFVILLVGIFYVYYILNFNYENGSGK